jgi:hypothetical protein
VVKHQSLPITLPWIAFLQLPIWILNSSCCYICRGEYINTLYPMCSLFKLVPFAQTHYTLCIQFNNDQKNDCICINTTTPPHMIKWSKCFVQ